MADPLLTYSADELVGTIALDDGRVNALSPAMQASIHGARDEAIAADRVDLEALFVKPVIRSDG